MTADKLHASMCPVRGTREILDDSTTDSTCLWGRKWINLFVCSVTVLLTKRKQKITNGWHCLRGGSPEGYLFGDIDS